MSRVSVAPHTGAWIETFYTLIKLNTTHVAPHTGAWIETSSYDFTSKSRLVAPHTGAWIETASAIIGATVEAGRTPHGCVD